ncbi:hypothetical protein NECAME_08994 [Necator americanus]|uniref:Uncharacterized protein n=1 Tax=Necator americanus TaxID=51031 RepID=W2TI53_NECAM|nr:hypothetical protein NECAME_08994 [Necator americanus]ETN80712.1 hypothetical protein NECAME_08994 [Necator americanus]
MTPHFDAVLGKAEGKRSYTEYSSRRSLLKTERDDYDHCFAPHHLYDLLFEGSLEMEKTEKQAFEVLP